MILYSFQLLFSSTFFLAILSLSIIEHTLNRHRSYRDCFIDPTSNKEFDDYLLYCLRIDDDLNEHWSNACYTGTPITFNELQRTGVTANQLTQWHIPLDVADIYGAFLSGNFPNDHIEFICNCSLSNTFGRSCEYSFEEEIDTIEDLIQSSMEEKKKFYPKERLLPCYDLENEKEPCLDYRDICDKEFDIINGTDELYCHLIETNTCNENEFRCRHGLCIAREFLFDGQGDCNDLTDEQSLLILVKHENFENCYKQATFDCDEHWCGREMISCGDGECIPWFQRFWAEHDCHNFYTHVHNCELEERHNKSIDFSITDNNGRCKANITEFNPSNNSCLLMIKCAITLHPTCQSLNIIWNNYTKAIGDVYHLCRNHTFINYASGAKFVSPFVHAYYTLEQFHLTTELDFFALMKVRIPGRFCLLGEYICQGVKVIQNGSECFEHEEIYDKKYPFPPYEYLFCRSANLFIDPCVNLTLFYRCRTTGECISKHRLFDGFADCLDLSDENDTDALNVIPALFMKYRYNCTIDGSQSTAVMHHFLGDGFAHCMKGTDEMSRSINWQQQHCFKSDDFACRLLRDVYNETKEEQSMQIVRFTSLCDSVWDLRDGLDETDCDEWKCEPGWIQQTKKFNRWSGSCIDPSWKCNGIWDFTDGSDELNCKNSEPYPIPNCLSLQTRELILFNESNEIAGNGSVDCSGGVDERVTFACKDGFPLNERFLCNDQITCLEPKYLCNHLNDCKTGEDESEYWCGSRPSSNSNVCNANEFACQERDDSGPCIPQEDRCHEERSSCIYSHRDKYMCIRSRHYNRIIHKNIPELEMQQTQSNRIPPWYCDRGLVVHRFGKLACLCPPSFYGHRCEKHSHRLTVIFTLDVHKIAADLIRINILLISSNQTIDHIQLTQSSSYKKKHRIYLNYPRSFYSNLRNISNEYNVQFLLHAVYNNTIKFLSKLQYPIKYPFLPAFRLAVALRYSKKSQTSNQSNSTICHCAQDSECLIFGDKPISCVCSTERYGPTCHLTTTSCPLDFCHNQGVCVSFINKFYAVKFRCLCSENHFGDKCEEKKATLFVHFSDKTSTSSTVRMVQLISSDMVKMQLQVEGKYYLSTNSEEIFYNNSHLPSIGLLKVYQPNLLDIYLLYVGENYTNLILTEQNKTKCKHAKEFGLIPMNNSDHALLFIFKRYHRPCYQLNQKTQTVCFYDSKRYFCFCNQSTQRSACFLYDFTSDQCNQCLNGGQCIQGTSKKKSDIFCLCPPCYNGRRCEFSSEPFGFTLDSLMVQDSFIIQMLYLFLATLLFLIGLLTNTCSFVTFKRPTPRSFGVGYYLFAAAILNQLSLFFLVVKILSIVLGTKHIAHIFSCKSIAYSLSVSTRANYWLTTWITIERLVIILFPVFTTLRNPKTAILIMNITFLVVSGMHFHELISYTVIEYSSLCVPIFQSSLISIYSQAALIFHHLIPFLVQVVMITLLIILAARSRHRSGGQKTTFRLALTKQFHTHKELYFTPAIIVLVLSILPQGILSFSVACTELKHWQRYILLSTYFLSYIPQTLGFILQVLPSSGYTKQFRETSIGKLRFFCWMVGPKLRQKKEPNMIDMPIISAGLDAPEEGLSERSLKNAIDIL